MSVPAALRAALVDSYHHSWRLLPLNTVLAAAALGVALAASYVQAAALLAVALGPLAAALMHCAVALAQTDELRLRDAVTGLRLHWRRGLALGALAGATGLLGGLAAAFYWDAGAAAWPLAALVAYLLALFATAQLVLWPLAVFEREAPLRAVLRESAATLVRRPLATLGLAAALLLVNAAGAAAILPLLTLTVAYSFVAAAHFALPRGPLREAVSDG